MLMFEIFFELRMPFVLQIIQSSLQKCCYWILGNNLFTFLFDCLYICIFFCISNIALNKLKRLSPYSIFFFLLQQIDKIIDN